MAVSSYRIRILLTCWIIFALHFATDFVREHYLVPSIGDNFSFQFTGYEGLHDDIFTLEEHGSQHGANPGASLVAVVVFSIFIWLGLQARYALAGVLVYGVWRIRAAGASLSESQHESRASL